MTCLSMTHKLPLKHSISEKNLFVIGEIITKMCLTHNFRSVRKEIWAVSYECLLNLAYLNVNHQLEVRNAINFNITNNIKIDISNNNINCNKNRTNNINTYISNNNNWLCQQEQLQHWKQPKRNKNSDCTINNNNNRDKIINKNNNNNSNKNISIINKNNINKIN